MATGALIIVIYSFFGIMAVGIGVYAWQRKDRVRGARYFALAILAEASWTLGYVLESLSTTLDGKLFWDNVQFGGYLYAPVLFVIFILKYLDYNAHMIQRTGHILLAIASFFMLLVISNPLHGLVRYDSVLIETSASSVLYYSPTAFFYVSALFAYCNGLAVLHIVLMQAWKWRKERWQPMIIIAFGMLVPLGAGSLTMAGVNFWGERDVMPLAFSISNIFWAWGILYYHLLNVGPIAREKTFVNSDDAIIVLDPEDVIVDLNPRAWTLVGGNNPINRTFAEIFPDWQHLRTRNTAYTQQKFIISSRPNDTQKYYQLIFSTLTDESGLPVGTMLTARDQTEIITAQQTLADQARNLELMIEVSSKITTILDLDVLLPEIARLTQESFQLYHVFIFLYDPDDDVLCYVADAGFGKPQLPSNFQMPLESPDSLIAHVARTRQAIMDDTTQNAVPGYHVEGLEAAHSELAIPMSHGDDLIGVLVLASTDAHFFNAVNIHTLENLAEQIAIAVNNGHVVQRSQELQRETALLYAIGQDLNTVSDFEGIVQTLHRHLQAGDVTIRLALNDTFDHRTATLTQEVAYTTLDGYELPPRTFPLGLVGRMLPQSTWVVKKAVDNPVPLVREQMIEADMESLLLVQLHIQDRRLGVLYLVSPIANRFSSSDRRVLGNIADSLAATVERIRLFNEQVQIAEQLRTVDDTKSQFLASMSHELRTPLNAILNFNKILLMEKIGSLTDRQRDLLTKSLSSSEHLLALINDVLDITKIEANMLELYIENNIDLYLEIMATVASIEPMLNDKPDVRLVLDIDANLPSITADRRRLRQIMMNLLSNAAKFTESGSITFSAKVSKDNTLLLAISDTGPGISPDQQQIIFDPFTQTDTGIRHRSGTGLGLPISKRLVEAHGGTLLVESEPEDGAVFFVRLPLYNENLIALVHKE